MLFYCTYLMHDKESQIEGYKIFANMSSEDIKNEIPEGCVLIGRWHDLTNGSGVVIAEAQSQDELMSWFMKWTPYCSYPEIRPVVDDVGARKLIRQAYNR